MQIMFLLFLFAAYLVLVGVSTVIGVIMLFSDKFRLKGKLLILTGLISLPTLLCVTGTMILVFSLPLIGFFRLMEHLQFVAPSVIVLFSFFFVIGYFALHHWYIGHIIIKNYLTDRPFGKGLDSDYLYNLVLVRFVDWFERKNHRQHLP
jgi:hypothetical protein